MYSSVCVVEGHLLAVGGAEDWDGSKKTSAIYAFRHDTDQTWMHIGDLPFKCSWVETVLLSEGGLLMVDGCSQQVLKIAVEGTCC